MKPLCLAFCALGLLWACSQGVTDAPTPPTTVLPQTPLPSAVPTPTALPTSQMSATPTPPPEPAPVAPLSLNSGQRQMADQIISIFENDTPELQYSYAENLDDGRGITAGRAGFTSATGDMLEVIEKYTERFPQNPLASYLPELRTLAANEDESTDPLQGLEQAWQQSAQDPEFRKIQDQVVDQEYYLPALAHAQAQGLSWPLSLLCLYDAEIQHGDGEDPDGVPALLARTQSQVGGTPLSGIEEDVWLAAFLQIRKADLLQPSNHETQAEWSESVGRVAALQSLLEQGKTHLSPPLSIAPWGDSFSLPAP